MHLAEILGIGRTRAEEKWTLGLVDLAVQAAGAALDEAGNGGPTAVVVGNALGGALGDQRNLAPYLARRLGLTSAETHNIADDEASGGAALRLALVLLATGEHDAVLVVGAEKVSDALADEVEAARATGLDAMREAGFGFGPAVAAGLGMRSYVDQHGIGRELFYHLPATAHLHAAANRLAFFPWELSREQYEKSAIVADPLTVCDQAPLCDGAAAVLIGRPSARADSRVRIIGSAAVSTTPGIAGPVLDLELPAARRSARAALDQAGLAVDQVSVFDLHDSNSFIAALSIEAVGLAPRGRALARAADGEFRFDGAAPLWTFGGLKARGHAPGASGLFQVAEAALQLRGEAGGGQVDDARTALVQCLGSFGSTAVTHVLGA